MIFMQRYNINIWSVFNINIFTMFNTATDSVLSM